MTELDIENMAIYANDMQVAKVALFMHTSKDGKHTSLNDDLIRDMNLERATSKQDKRPSVETLK